MLHRRFCNGAIAEKRPGFVSYLENTALRNSFGARQFSYRFSFKDFAEPGAPAQTQMGNNCDISVATAPSLSGAQATALSSASCSL
jgi:hypothetical protein